MRLISTLSATGKFVILAVSFPLRRKGVSGRENLQFGMRAKFVMLSFRDTDRMSVFWVFVLVHITSQPPASFHAQQRQSSASRVDSDSINT
jgi:hypothetical protein